MSDSSSATAAKNADEKQERGQSSIQFPYLDLDDAVEVATSVFGVSGAGPCEIDQLAAKMQQSQASSGFRLRLTTARLFGLIETDRTGGGGIKLTDLGQRINDPSLVRQAKAAAFLSIELYKQIYENYRGKVLPPAAALEREMVSRGVAQKQAARARQVFERSAETGGFYEFGRDRLVLPAGAQADAGGADKEKPKTKDNGGGGGDDGSVGLNLDPLLIASLKMIPPKGEEWPAAKRVRWFKAFAMNASQVYDDDDSPVEIDVKLASGEA